MTGQRAMAGIYFHIPFCRKACTYCDFHFSTSTRMADEVHAAMVLELESRTIHLKDQDIKTIYFGGGTPSILATERIEQLIQRSRNLLPVEPEAEITLEANPDDITRDRLEEWKRIGITRLSVGIQSFREDRLAFMGRAHTAEDSFRSMELIAAAGFGSWTIDLIYGLPEMTLSEWDEQLGIALGHGMPHLSAYCLTVEPRTALAHQVKEDMVRMPEDDVQSAQFDHLMDRMEKAGMVHYEISNFGLPGHFSRHNTAYWERSPYLGIGPSAHSFDGVHRRWNIANNVQYAKAISNGTEYWEQETLTAMDRTNERLLTGLRTIDGVPLKGLELNALEVNSGAFERHRKAGNLLVVDGRLVLTRAGRHFADRIASDLFITTDDS